MKIFVRVVTSPGVMIPSAPATATSWSAIAARCGPSSASIRFFGPVSLTPAATSQRRCAVSRRRSAAAHPSPDSR